MSDIEFKDALGNALNVGDRVASGTRVGNYGRLLIGTVESLGSHPYLGTIAQLKTDRGRKTEKACSELVRVLTPEFAQQAASDARSAEWLSCLEDAGVDNWQGFDEARNIARERKAEGA